MSASRTGSKLVTQWRCPQCHKYLSSKRSYREHMNVHGKVRPFKCEMCNYAAASQMTLRRHRLRSHVPRRDWGYPCPYCSEIYMEPASYQQHVSHRHFGQSCTFGCPHKNCNFTSKCTKSFVEHINKHLVIITSDMEDEYTDGIRPSDISAVQCLVDDEIGSGYGKPPRRAQIQRYPDVLSLTKQETPQNRKKQAVKTNHETDMRKCPSRGSNSVEDKTQLPEEDIQEESPSSWEDNEEIYYEMGDEEDYKEEYGEPQYYELVDENGAVIDNQIYYYQVDPEVEYVEESTWETTEEAHIPMKPPTTKDERRLPDGQIDIELD